MHIERVWFPQETLKLAFKVYPASVPTPARKILYLDAHTGDLISFGSGATHDNGLVYPWDAFPNFYNKPPSTTLLDVVQHSFNGGRSIRGRDFHSSNTCFHYQCPTANCTELQSYCVDPTPNMTQGKDYRTTDYYFASDAKYIDLYKDWDALGYKNGLIIMKWENAAVFAPRLTKPQGDWGSNIDFSTLSGREQNDAFAELQAYHLFTLHAQFMRNLTQSSDRCFFGTGQNCTQMDPRSNRTGTQYDTPLRFVVNYQSINTFPTDSKYPDFLTQMQQGKGKTVQDPIIFDQSTDYADAFFTAGSQMLVDNRDCSDGSCVSLYDAQFAHFAFGQTAGPSGSDWALNSCIVFHELTHAFVFKFIPDLPSYTWSPNGMSSEPGALNEAWADYFAAIHCGIADFTKTYNSRPRRSLINSNTCVDKVGEVHADSIVFSGALWKIRSMIPGLNGLQVSDQTLFDKIVLKSLMMGQATDNFTTQLKMILQLLQTDPKLNVLYQEANAEFTRRVFDCHPVTRISEQSDPTFSLPDARTTPKKRSTTPTQLLIQPRKSDWQVSVKWKQWFQSPLLGPLYSGYGQSQMDLLVSPCEISIENPEKPVGLCQTNVSLSWNKSMYKNQTREGYFDFSVSGDTYLWIGSSVNASMVLYSSSFTFYGFNNIWRYTFAVVGCMQLLFLLTHLILFFLKWIKVFNRDQSLMIFVAVNAFVQAGAASLAIIGIIFGIVRDLMTVLMFCTIPVQTLCDLLFLWNAVIPVPKLGFRKWMLMISIGWLVIGMCSLAIVISYDTPIWLHALFYCLFVAVWLTRQLTLVYPHFVKRTASAVELLQQQ
ncbi:hypothetical protein EDD86DRAFT_193144 [Gorgonomyces haynaldii]|nr:hypothetical protein EDD86DRAFT_193144 [Gorgonomyces haynaldii]